MNVQNPLTRLPGIFTFLREVKIETRRINWPTRKKTVRDTLIVIVFAAAIALFLSLFDFIFQFLLDSYVI